MLMNSAFGAQAAQMLVFSQKRTIFGKSFERYHYSSIVH
jgi:hypothetical protein